MPGDFLPMLRQTNVLPRDRARDRPFGMPEIDTTGPGTLMREVLPTASSMMDDDVRRKKDLMQFEASLQGGGRGGMTGPSQGRGINPGMMRRPQTVGGDYQMPKNVVAGPGAAGMSATQQMFRQEDVRNQQQNFNREMQGQEIGGRYRQAMDVRNAADEAAWERNQADIEGTYQNTRLRGDMQSQIDYENDVRNSIQKKIEHGYKLTEDEKRIYHETRGGMLRDQADPSKNRGYLKSPKDEMDQINLNIQRFRIEHPELSDVIAPAVEGEPVQVDWSRLDPQQTRFVKEMITGRPQPETVSPVAPGTPQPTRRKGAEPLSNRRRLPSQSGVSSTRMPAYQSGVPPSGRGR